MGIIAIITLFVLADGISLSSGHFGTRMSKSNFRAAVEIDMLTRMLATVVQLSKSDYDKLRAKSIHDVKQTNGSIGKLKQSMKVNPAIYPNEVNHLPTLLTYLHY